MGTKEVVTQINSVIANIYLMLWCFNNDASLLIMQMCMHVVVKITAHVVLVKIYSCNIFCLKTNAENMFPIHESNIISFMSQYTLQNEDPILWIKDGSKVQVLQLNKFITSHWIHLTCSADVLQHPGHACSLNRFIWMAFIWYTWKDSIIAFVSVKTFLKAPALKTKRQIVLQGHNCQVSR